MNVMSERVHSLFYFMTTGGRKIQNDVRTPPRYFHHDVWYFDASKTKIRSSIDDSTRDMIEHYFSLFLITMVFFVFIHFCKILSWCFLSLDTFYSLLSSTYIHSAPHATSISNGTYDRERGKFKIQDAMQSSSVTRAGDLWPFMARIVYCPAIVL